MTISRRGFSQLFAASLMLAMVASPVRSSAETAPKAVSAADHPALARTLRAGGLIILMRHGATFSNQADMDPFNLADISKQRNLNDKGKELARAFGAALRSAGFRFRRSLGISAPT